MAYVKTIWENLPSENTPINASNLNKIENGIYNNSIKADQVGDLTQLKTTTKTDLVNAINEITMEITTGSDTNLEYIVKKYDNGLMEIDMSYQVSTTVSNSWGNAYISPEITPPNFPVSFTAIPFMQFSVYASDGTGSWVMNGTPPTKDYPPKFNLIRGSSQTTSKTFYIQIYAIGMWE